MDIKARFIIFHVDLQDGSFHCLFDDDENLPSLRVKDNCPPIQNGPDILEQYLDIKPDWVTFYLVDVELDSDNTIYIYYTCIIPHVIKSKIGKWIEIGTIDNEHIQKIVFQAGQRAIVGV